MKKITKFLASASVCAGMFVSLSATAVTTLKVGTWLPPTAPQNAIVWPTWAKWVEEATEGRVKVELEYGLGHPKSMFDLVEDQVIDASFTVNGYVPGRFSLGSIAELPGESSDAEKASVALWKVQEKYFNQANEYDGLKLLGLFVHGPGQLHTTFPVNSLADLKDKKIRIGGGVATEVAKRLEVTEVAAPAPKIYEMMQQGVVEGVFLPALDLKYLRLAEVSKYLTAFPDGMYTTTFSFFINPDSFAALSEKDQKALMSVSGEKLSRLAGKTWGEADANGYAAAKENGIVINRLSETDPMVLELKAKTDDMAAHWIETAKAKNVDGAAALEMFRSLAK
ncbi:TRAP-type C4-dicarboxylate transport system, substrate-binding protein [Amphritea atlantica]|uniref:TRAP-type C4-dicarboxylate transport system, substrate-binding protein n=1 Tax=Amphritea atlantica TaxID=355243 RepID=A0A1H9HIJ6_9GAMM|nr:TRAP transporter substrate-binding protein [Amphritea atlantica]SEQ62135.1 TRAP-type C4-dicarboxylate transport system, substrate-binding protein [Amphritea atlantica]